MSEKRRSGVSGIKLVLVRSHFEDLLRRLRGPVHDAAAREARVAIGISRSAGSLELIARPVDGPRTAQALSVTVAEHFEAPPRTLPADCLGLLRIYAGGKRGSARAWCDMGHGIRPIDEIRLVGAGMFRIDLHPAEAGMAAPPVRPERLDRWSRTIGALGLAAWSRLTALHFGIIGQGNVASQLMRGIIRIGCEHVAHVRQLDEPLLELVKACDLLFIATSDEELRSFASDVAALYCKPLLDVSLHPDTDTGAVSLLLPGRCLACSEPAVQGMPAALAAVLDEDVTFAELAVGIGLRVVENLLSESLSTSQIARISIDPQGRLSVLYPELPTVRCPVCAMCGLGDEGMRHLSAGWS